MDLSKVKKSTASSEVLARKLEELSKKFKDTGGKGELSVGANFKKPEVIPTGIPELDNHILGIGGLAQGRVIEIAGETNAGKTTLSLNFCREAVAMGKSVVIAENEGTFTGDYAEKVGLPPEDYYLLKGKGLTGPEYLEEIMRLSELGADIIVMDSLFGIQGLAASTARLTDMKMNTKQSTPQLIAAFAGLWKGGWKPLTKNSTKLVKGVDGGTTLIIINHLKPVFDGHGMTASGNIDIGFLYSQRIWLERLGMSTEATDLDENGDPIYTRVNVMGKKSKLSPGGRSAILYIDNRNGRFVTDGAVIVDSAVRKEIVTKKGSWLYITAKAFEVDPYLSEVIPADMKWQGGAKFVELANSRPDLLKSILQFEDRQ